MVWDDITGRTEMMYRLYSYKESLRQKHTSSSQDLQAGDIIPNDPWLGSIGLATSEFIVMYYSQM